MDGTIRTAGPEDAAGVAAIYAPIVRDTHTSFETVVPSADEMWRRIETTLPRYPWLVCVGGGDVGEVLGYAYASEHRPRCAYQWAVETTVYITESARRTGVGRALYDRLFEILVRQGFTRAIAGVSLPNEASVGFHESFAFERIATYPHVGYKFGKWYDTGWWQRPLAPEGDPPVAPVWFADLGEA